MDPYLLLDVSEDSPSLHSSSLERVIGPLCALIRPSNELGKSLRWFHLSEGLGGSVVEAALDLDEVLGCLCGHLTKHGSCHLFRHTTATLMLDAGADVRHIAEMLGHAKLETTMTYTRVSMVKLHEVHARCHPAERAALAR
jgi:integrase